MPEAPTDAMTEDSLFDLLSLGCRVCSDGTLRYYNTQGQMHRGFGPAIEYSSGSREWWQNGKRHRVDGPAVEYNDGHRAWFQNGLLHRLDGPAIEYGDGSSEWYINGNQLTEAEWQQAVASMETVFLPR